MIHLAIGSTVGDFVGRERRALGRTVRRMLEDIARRVSYRATRSMLALTETFVIAGRGIGVLIVMGVIWSQINGMKFYIEGWFT